MQSGDSGGLSPASHGVLATVLRKKGGAGRVSSGATTAALGLPGGATTAAFVLLGGLPDLRERTVSRAAGSMSQTWPTSVAPRRLAAIRARTRIGVTPSSGGGCRTGVKVRCVHGGSFQRSFHSFDNSQSNQFPASPCRTPLSPFESGHSMVLTK